MDYQDIFMLASNLRFKKGKGVTYDEIVNPNYKLFSASDPVYICNLHTGKIEYKKNLELLFPNSIQNLTLKEMNAFIHPDDKPKVDHIVRNTLEYLVGTGLNPRCHLSISYRILMETDRYIQVNRISRMIKIPGQEPTFNFSVLR